MPDKPLFDAEKVTILEIKLMKGQVDAPDDFLIEHVKGHRIKSGFDLGFNVDEKLAKADFNVDIETDSGGENKGEATGSFHFVFVYKIENLGELAHVDEKQKFIVDGGLGHSLASITYSTARGVLFTRLQGTALQNFILPVINPGNLFVK